MSLGKWCAVLQCQAVCATACMPQSVNAVSVMFYLSLDSAGSKGVTSHSGLCTLATWCRGLSCGKRADMSWFRHLLCIWTQESRCNLSILLLRPLCTNHIVPKAKQILQAQYIFYGHSSPWSKRRGQAWMCSWRSVQSRMAPQRLCTICWGTPVLETQRQ